MTAYSQQDNAKPDSPDVLQERVLCVKLLQEQDLRPLRFTLYFSLQASSISTGEKPGEGGDLGVQDVGLLFAEEYSRKAAETHSSVLPDAASLLQSRTAPKTPFICPCQ